MTFLNQEKKEKEAQTKPTALVLHSGPLAPSDAAPAQQQGQAECLAQASEEMQLGDIPGTPSTGHEKGESVHWRWSPSWTVKIASVFAAESLQPSLSWPGSAVTKPSLETLMAVIY